MEMMNDGLSYGILIILAAVVQAVTATLAIDNFNNAALRQVTRIRIKYFQSLMRQDISWYDVCGNNNNFAVRITE